MAWQNYGWVWNVVGVQGSEYVVLFFLANEADVHGIAERVRVQRIMQTCNISRRSTFEHLKKLEQKGFIQRTKKWRYDGSQGSSSFKLDLKRWFPDSEHYKESYAMWETIVRKIENIGKDRIDDWGLRVLRLVKEAWYQKNAHCLWLVTNVDDYEETLVKNIAVVKEAAFILKLPIKRFETFRPPFLK